MTPPDSGADRDPDGVDLDFPAPAWRRGSVLVLVVAGVVVAVVRLVLAATAPDDVDEPDRGTIADAVVPEVFSDPSVVLPALEDLMADAELPAGPEGGLTVGDRGFTAAADRFDDTRTGVTFAALVTNPAATWTAQAVAVRVDVVAADGTVVASTTELVDVILPGRTVAVAGVAFDLAGTPHGVEVSIDVARWRETPDPVVGELSVDALETRASPLSGATTTATITSAFPDPVHDVRVVVVHRAADGRVLGGFSTDVAGLDPGGSAEVTVDVPVAIDVDTIATTEVYTAPRLSDVPGT